MYENFEVIYETKSLTKYDDGIRKRIFTIVNFKLTIQVEEIVEIKM